MKHQQKQQLHLSIQGLIQGVGFRPFIVRLAHAYHQTGWVKNTARGVTIVIEGNPEQQQHMIQALRDQKPPFAEIDSLRITAKPISNLTNFVIHRSNCDGQPSAWTLPDIAPCAECLADLCNPASRFFDYPFTSCSHCGPRYSILLSLPFDRERTSMHRFTLCTDCHDDYRNPNNRRFHAQTIACPACGPSLALCDSQHRAIAEREQALIQAAAWLRQGKILALKGVGGFQLLVNATDQDAVARLRIRKQRPHKPFALLCKDLTAARQLVLIDALAKQALECSASPIVILPRQPECGLAAAVAPENTHLGIMLPASPLHVLLTQAFDGPLVATSGNLQQEPLCHENAQALQSLAGIADAFLLHDRDIVRPLDDRVVRPLAGKITVLRRARGYAPLPIRLDEVFPPMLALGAHFKNTVAISNDHFIIDSQHLGDPDTAAAQALFKATIDDMQRLFAIQPQAVCHDRHPDYFSSLYAAELDLPTYPLAHHQAHVFACMAEHRLKPPVMGFAWDGSGLGTDNSLCGSECLLLNELDCRRVAHLRPLALPGGDQAAKQPRRSALALLFCLYGNNLPSLPILKSFEPAELTLLKQMLHKDINCPISSSAGRLFDGVAGLLGLSQINHFEGQAAMRLEQAALKSACTTSYPFHISNSLPAEIDWRPMILVLLTDIGSMPLNDIAAKFHNTLAEMILKIAQRVGQQRIVLSGGCFQNACLMEKTLNHLQSNGFLVYRHENVPPNDAGIAVGQLYATGLSLLSTNRA